MERKPRALRLTAEKTLLRASRKALVVRRFQWLRIPGRCVSIILAIRGLPRRVRLLSRRPPLIFVPGHRPAQYAMACSLGNARGKGVSVHKALIDRG